MPCALSLLAGCSSIQLGTGLGAPVSDGPRLPVERAWERDVQGAFGPSAAYVTAPFVVVGTRQGEVVVLDRASGRIEGVGEFGASVEGRIAVSADGEVLYVPLADEDGGVVAYAVRNGTERWRWKGAAVEGGVLLQNGALIVATLGGEVLALDEATGEPRWTVGLAPGAHVHAAPVEVDEQAVIVVDDRGDVRRLDTASGTAAWTVTVGAPAYDAPAVAGGVVYVPTTRGTLHALDAETGRERWVHEVGAGVRVSTPAVAGDRVAIGTTADGVRLIDAATGALRWRYPTDGNVSAAPLWVGETLFVGTMDERVVVLDGATGEEVWSDAVRGRVKSALAAGGGLVVVLTEPRHVVAYRAADPGGRPMIRSLSSLCSSPPPPPRSRRTASALRTSGWRRRTPRPCSWTTRWRGRPACGSASPRARAGSPPSATPRRGTPSAPTPR